MSKEKTSESNGWTNSVYLAIVVGGIGLLSSIITSTVQHVNDRELERIKLESNLILRAIDTNDQEESITNLRFFLNLGLFEEFKETLNGMLSNPEILKSIPALQNNKLVSVRKFLIVDPDRNPINDVSVFYNEVHIGETDKNGTITAFTSSKLSAETITCLMAKANVY